MAPDEQGALDARLSRHVTASPDAPGSPDVSVPLIIDARGMRCPWPVLRAARAMRANTPFVMLCDDPIARNDVPEMALARGWQCTLADNKGGTEFFLTL